MNDLFVLISALLSLMFLGCGPGVEPQGELSTQQEKNIPPDDWSNGPWKNQYPTAECVAVIDGDTVDLLIDSNKTIRVRLASIDAPEPGQPFGSAAQKMLSELISGKKVRYDMTRPDKEGRVRAFLYVGIDGKPTDVNLQLVVAGLAWPADSQSPDAVYTTNYKSARQAKRGLFADSRYVEPWEWRKLSEVEKEKLR